MKDKVIKVLDNYTEIQRVQSVIEEPELNLFPETQQKLIYELISDATNSENQITITTHSPYILFALNNCMMGGLVRDNIPEEDRPTFESYTSWIDPKLVSVYEIQDRTIRRIQDADGIIEDNYLNQAYKDNVNEYVGLLNYYDDEE
jgi:predicted ATP-binding protein involved in virulence